MDHCLANRRTERDADADLARLLRDDVRYEAKDACCGTPLGDVADYAQTVFASRYRSRYGTDPTPDAVRWYEGTGLIARAIAAKEITGSDPQANRRSIREWLASLNGPESAADGVAGSSFFDAHHDAQRGMAVGVFHEGRLISAPVQLILESET
jgi:hypothetical protein